MNVPDPHSAVHSSVQVRTVKKARVHTETKKVTPAMAARKVGQVRRRAEVQARRRVHDGGVHRGDLPGEIPRDAKSESEKQGDELAKMASSNTSLLVCRICGKKGDHWTTKRPYKDLASMNTLGLGDSKPRATTTGPAGARQGRLRAAVNARGRQQRRVMGESMNRRREENLSA